MAVVMQPAKWWETSPPIRNPHLQKSDLQVGQIIINNHIFSTYTKMDLFKFLWETDLSLAPESPWSIIYSRLTFLSFQASKGCRTTAPGAVGVDTSARDKEQRTKWITQHFTACSQSSKRTCATLLLRECDKDCSCDDKNGAAGHHKARSICALVAQRCQLRRSHCAAVAFTLAGAAADVWGSRVTEAASWFLTDRWSNYQ